MPQASTQHTLGDQVPKAQVEIYVVDSTLKTLQRTNLKSVFPALDLKAQFNVKVISGSPLKPALANAIKQMQSPGERQIETRKRRFNRIAVQHIGQPCVGADA